MLFSLEVFCYAAMCLTWPERRVLRQQEIAGLPGKGSDVKALVTG